LLESVLTNATGTTINQYTQTKLKSKTGMTGSWFNVDYDNVFFSKVRSMARYGLLMQNNCIWNTDTLLFDTAYINQMTNTSQSFNLSYGYLWWLNGKSSYMVPTSQFVFQGAYAPDAPADMFAGIGKNGQILSVSKSKGLVVVRMGNQVSGGEVTLQLCNSIWQKLNAVMCNTVQVQKSETLQSAITIFPNPAQNVLNISMNGILNYSVQITNSIGKVMFNQQNQKSIDISSFPKGFYILSLTSGEQVYTGKFIKQ
jgi:hypothetical protein